MADIFLIPQRYWSKLSLAKYYFHWIVTKRKLFRASTWSFLPPHRVWQTVRQRAHWLNAEQRPGQMRTQHSTPFLSIHLHLFPQEIWVRGIIWMYQLAKCLYSLSLWGLQGEWKSFNDRRQESRGSAGNSQVQETGSWEKWQVSMPLVKSSCNLCVYWTCHRQPPLKWLVSRRSIKFRKPTFNFYYLGD